SIKGIAQGLDRVAEPDGFEFLDGASRLQGDETQARNVGERSKFAQRDRPQLVQMRGARVLPGDPDLEAVVAKALSPGRHTVRIRRQKRSVAWHCFGHGAENS